MTTRWVIAAAGAIGVGVLTASAMLGPTKHVVVPQSEVTADGEHKTGACEADKQANRRKSAVRSIVEHPFLTLKRLWGFAKTRYRGLAKNANRAYAMLALINLNKWGRPLTGVVRPA